MSEDELVNRIAELEDQVAKLKKAGESRSAIEEARKRIFGIVRDGMASEGGKIVG